MASDLLDTTHEAEQARIPAVSGLMSSSIEIYAVGLRGLGAAQRCWRAILRNILTETFGTLSVGQNDRTLAL